jgi:hypothetical protein
LRLGASRTSWKTGSTGRADIMAGLILLHETFEKRDDIEAKSPVARGEMQVCTGCRRKASVTSP